MGTSFLHTMNSLRNEVILAIKQMNLTKLKDMNFDLESRDGFGETALFKALEVGSLDAVIVLLEKGANVNSKSETGHTPLHWACYYGRPDILQVLLAAKANVSAFNAFNADPMYYATHYEKPEVSQIMTQLLRDAEQASK